MLACRFWRQKTEIAIDIPITGVQADIYDKHCLSHPAQLPREIEMNEVLCAHIG